MSHMRRALLLTAVALMASATVTVITPGAASADGTDPTWAVCSQHTIPVTTSATDPTVYNITGRLCLRDNAVRGLKTVEVMVSGLTYDHNYFNISYQPNTYSYVYAATSRGYSTFNIDRLGVGGSDKPPAEKLTVQTHAYTIMQIIQKLRAGAIGGRAFTTVVAIGHSLGAGILQYLSGTYTDPLGLPDYLILSGWLHQGNATTLGTLAGSLYDATTDPLFTTAGLPAGYLTTKPNTRGPVFYNTPYSETAMITLDESIKQTGTLVERSTLAAVRGSTVTLNITVPVLLSVGQYDSLQCDAAQGLLCATAANLLAREQASYGPRACLTAYASIGSGHSVNLHQKARDSYNYHHSWLDSYTVNNVGAKDANGCLPAP